MNTISKSFYHVANAVGTAARSAFDLLSGEWLTSASYGFDDKKVALDRLDNMLLDKYGVVVTNYTLRELAAGAGAISALPLMLHYVPEAMFASGGLPLHAAAAAFCVGVPAAMANIHAAGSAVRYGLTKLYNEVRAEIAEKDRVESPQIPRSMGGPRPF